MSQDVDLAQSVVAALKKSGVNLKYQVTTNKFSSSNEITSANDYSDNNHAALNLVYGLERVDENNKLLARLLFHFQKNNGQVMPGIYFQPPRIKHPTTNESSEFVVISGGSGETLRAPKYTQTEIQKGVLLKLVKTLRSKFDLIPKQKDIHKRLSNIDQLDLEDFYHGKHRMYSEGAARHAALVWHSYLSEANQAGIVDFRMFDYFAIAAQQSRRTGLGRDSQRMYPLASQSLMNSAFQLKPNERAENRYHTALISRLAPDLAGIPFSFELEVPKEEIRRDNSRFPLISDEVRGISGFSHILQNSENWNDSYHSDRIIALFEGQSFQLNDYQKDRTACQLAWRAATSQYPKLVNAYLDSSRE